MVGNEKLSDSAVSLKYDFDDRQMSPNWVNDLLKICRKVITRLGGGCREMKGVQGSELYSRAGPRSIVVLSWV